jgi:hypothetical protein
MAVTDFRESLRLNSLPVHGLVPETSSAPPATPVEGQLWADSVNHVVKFWNLTTWKNALDRSDHTGAQPAATISDLAATVKGYRLDEFTAPTAAVSLNGQRATNGADPVAATDLATRQYVDNARAGIAGVKDPVRAVATTNINLASLPATIGGVTMASGDGFLAAGQTTGTQNGIYVYGSSGGSATRRSDADLLGDIRDGTMVAVAEGTDAGTQYIQTATASGAPGAWTQTWVKFSTGGQTYTADGQGLELSSTTFSLELADATLSKSAAGLTIGMVPISKGGTGATTAAGARSALSAVGKYAANVPAITGGTPLQITHGLNTMDVQEPTLREIATGELVGVKPVVVDANTISITTASSYPAGTFSIVVIG